MKKDEVLKYIEAKPDTDFVVRTADEDNTFLQNHAKKIEEEIIPGKISELHNRYDEDIFSVTGIRKGATEKTYDFTKRVLSEFKTKAEKSEVLEREMADLKKQIKEGTGDKKTVADLEAVQRAYQELQVNSAKEIDTLKKQNEQREIRSEITSALSGYSFKKGIAESVRKAFIDQVINELTGTAEMREGKLVFLDKAGNPLRNAHNALNPYSAKELLDERLKEIIDTGRTINNGPGIENEITKEYDKGKLKRIALIVPDTIKTKDDLSKWLVSQKILRGTEEYKVAYAEYSPALPMR